MRSYTSSEWDPTLPVHEILHCQWTRSYTASERDPAVPMQENLHCQCMQSFTANAEDPTQPVQEILNCQCRRSYTANAGVPTLSVQEILHRQCRRSCTANALDEVITCIDCYSWVVDDNNIVGFFHLLLNGSIDWSLLCKKIWVFDGRFSKETFFHNVVSCWWTWFISLISWRNFN